MSPQLSVRTGNPTDADQLVPLFAALSHPATATQVRNRLERLAGDPTYELWVIEATTGGLIGFAAGHLLFPVEEDAPAAQLIALVSAEEARGQGVGTALCTMFEQWAIAKGAVRAQLNSGAKRTEAHAFYTRRDYTASGTRFTKSL
ncbi:GNAT family N-acetyltransferase [Nocardiopsis xinjiangensis]|uniref:GNAT family N-acetyltransferase n=1 Tax=Nocardiopsis xinjiangensis TaxID=124285 RepID=UPI000A047C7A|nr:GNAT family N-acetyltransferase [Nocardiopsis xinjiangensis]